MDEVQGFEEHQGETPWCVQCNHFLKWPSHDECIGCLTVGGRPAETVTVRTVHWDTASLHAIIRRKRAVWEARHPGWELVPDFARYWEDATHPSKYVDRETGIGRKLAWTRFRVERRHPRGRSTMGQIGAYDPSRELIKRYDGEGMWWEQRVGLLAAAQLGPLTHAFPSVRDPYIEGVRLMAEPDESEAPTPEEEPAGLPAAEEPDESEEQDAEAQPA